MSRIDLSLAIMALLAFSIIKWVGQDTSTASVSPRYANTTHTSTQFESVSPLELQAETVTRAYEVQPTNMLSPDEDVYLFLRDDSSAPSTNLSISESKANIPVLASWSRPVLVVRHNEIFILTTSDSPSSWVQWVFTIALFLSEGETLAQIHHADEDGSEKEHFHFLCTWDAYFEKPWEDMIKNYEIREDSGLEGMNQAKLRKIVRQQFCSKN